MAKEKSRTIQRISNKKRGRPKVRFHIGILIVLFVLAFAAIFVLYMLAANADDNFLEKEFGAASKIDLVQPEKEEQPVTETPDAGDIQEETTAAVRKDISNPVPQSNAMGAEYFDSSCLITDGTLLQMAEFTDFKDVLGSDALNALNCNSTKISTNYGTVTPLEALEIKQTNNVYVMLGSDIGTDPIDEMIENYSKLISELCSARSDLNIYIMQLIPAKDDISKNEIINEYNSKLLKMANSNKIYCIDTNTALKSQDGTLDAQFIDAETGKLNDAAYRALADYILTHTVQ